MFGEISSVDGEVFPCEALIEVSDVRSFGWADGCVGVFVSLGRGRVGEGILGLVSAV